MSGFAGIGIGRGKGIFGLLKIRRVERKNTKQGVYFVIAFQRRVLGQNPLEFKKGIFGPIPLLARAQRNIPPPSSFFFFYPLISLIPLKNFQKT